MAPICERSRALCAVTPTYTFNHVSTDHTSASLNNHSAGPHLVQLYTVIPVRQSLVRPSIQYLGDYAIEMIQEATNACDVVSMPTNGEDVMFKTCFC